MQENHRTKLVLFDLDGTLIDTAPDFLESLNNVLRKHNKDSVSMDEIRPHISEGTSKLIKLFFKINENDISFNLYKNQFLLEYELNLTNNSNLFEGMSDFIKFLDKESIQYGVVTNKYYKYAQPILDSFLELKNMKVLICPDHVNNSKPDPEGILQACKKLDINPENAIYLGDHLNDIKAGICAGVKTIACLYGYSINKNEIDNMRCGQVKKANEIRSFIVI